MSAECRKRDIRRDCRSKTGSRVELPDQVVLFTLDQDR